MGVWMINHGFAITEEGKASYKVDEEGASENDHD